MNEPSPHCFHPRRNSSPARCVTTLAAAAGLFLGLSQNAAAQLVSLDFSTAAQYTDNFQETLEGGGIGWNAGEFVRSNVSSNTNSILFDGAGIPGGPDNILTETTSFNLRIDTFGAATGIFTRVGANEAAPTLGVVALANFNSSTEVLLRMFYGASTTTSAVGTSFFNQTIDISANPISINNFNLLLTLTQTSSSVFNLTLSDAEGFVASTGDVQLTATSDYDGPGAVGIRTSRSGGAALIDIDNFTIAAIPEPGTWALAMSGFVLFAACLRRRRTRS